MVIKIDVSTITDSRSEIFTFRLCFQIAKIFLCTNLVCLSTSDLTPFLRVWLNGGVINWGGDDAGITLQMTDERPVLRSVADPLGQIKLSEGVEAASGFNKPAPGRSKSGHTYDN